MLPTVCGIFYFVWDMHYIGTGQNGWDNHVSKLQVVSHQKDRLRAKLHLFRSGSCGTRTMDLSSDSQMLYQVMYSTASLWGGGAYRSVQGSIIKVYYPT